MLVKSTATNYSHGILSLCGAPGQMWPSGIQMVPCVCPLRRFVRLYHWLGPLGIETQVIIICISCTMWIGYIVFIVFFPAMSTYDNFPLNKLPYWGSWNGVPTFGQHKLFKDNCTQCIPCIVNIWSTLHGSAKTGLKWDVLRHMP
jgi:hypothetical protein